MTDYNQFNGYANYPSFSYQQPRTNTYVFVNGVEGAKSYQMVPNQSILLMDSDNPICYFKTSNAMGQSTLRFFKLVEVTEQDVTIKPTDPEISALKQRVDELYNLLNKEAKKNA